MSVNLLKNLDFATKLNSTEAITEAGKELLKTYRAYMYTNAPTCGIVNGFVLEASKCSFDTGLNNILESVKEYINENNISWKLASACEAIEANNSQYNYINKIGVEQVQKLLEMNEVDVVSYIKAGVLKNIQYIPEFRAVCKEVYRTQVNEVQAPNYTVNTPVSYVYVNENKEQYFTVLGKVFKIAEDKVTESICDDVKFARINKLLESFQYDGKDLFIESLGAHNDKLRFAINENGLTFTRTGLGKDINETFENHITFQEYCDTISKIMQMNEKLAFMNLTSAISEVFEAYNNIVSLDQVKVLTTNNNTICAVIEAKDNVDLYVYRNVKNGNGIYEYQYMVEALNQIIKLTGIDLKALYEERINEDMKKLDPEAQAIKEQLEANKEAQYEIRKKKIAMLAEQYKNDPVKIALLSKVSKDLAILEKECCKEECTGKEDCQCSKCKKKREEAAKKEETSEE